MPTKTWAVGEEVLAADFNSYVQRQVVAAFPNAAARDAAIAAPAAGMAVYLTGVAAFQVYDGALWIEPGKQTYIPISTQTAGVPTSPVVVTGSGFSLPSRLRRYDISLMFSLYKATVAGAVSLSLTGTGLGGMLAVGSGLMAVGEGKTVAGHWSISGAAVTGGAVSATCTAGTANVDAGSVLTVTDVGSI